jgi:heat shock protein Hsp20
VNVTQETWAEASMLAKISQRKISTVNMRMVFWCWIFRRKLRKRK